MFIARLMVAGLTTSLAATAMGGQHVATGDFNGDGRDDLAIGAPFEDIGTISDCGVVHVIYGKTAGLAAPNDDYWHQNRPGIDDFPEFGDHFGRALAVGDFNGDDFDDLAIATDEDFNSGGVHILYGRPTGLTNIGTVLLTQDNASLGAVGNESFGFSLAAGDFDGDGFDDLAIGEPNETVDFISGAGAVNVVYGSATGLVRNVEQWHQQLGGVGDLLEPGDGFGNALAAGDFDGDGRDDLAVGVPSEDLGSILNVGMVHIIFGAPGGLTDIGSERWQQNSEGVADKVETGDFFGQVLSSGDFNDDGRDDLVIGVPFEKLFSQVHTGAVHVLYGSGGGLRANNDDFWHQNRAGISDDSETDDEFGVSVATGDFNGDGFDDVAIGSRGETFEAEKEEDDLEDCGAVHVLYGTPSGLKVNNSQFWHLDVSGVSGDADGSRFGTSMAAGDFDGDGFDDLAGSAPTETVDAVVNAGAVHVFYGSLQRLITTHGGKWWHQNVDGIADECETGDSLGGPAS